MKNHLKTNPWTDSPSFIEQHGDKIWLEICDNISEDFFRTVEIVDRIPYLKNFKESQRLLYLRTILNNVAKEWENLPPSGAGLTKVNARLFKWGKK